MILYKYTTRDGMKAIVKGNSFLVRPIDDYNDPFEGMPAFDEVGIGYVIENVLMQPRTLERLAQDEDILGGKYTKAQTRLLLRNGPTRDWIIQRLRDRSGLTFMEVARSFQEHFAGSYGLVCLSANPGNILMWSHYAEEHRGFVIGVDASRFKSDSVRKVNYTAERVKFTSSQPSGRDLRLMLTTKSIEWEYEDEYRILCTEKEWKVNNGRRIGFLRLPTEAVSCIWAGVRTNEKEIEEIRRLVSGSPFSGVKVLQARLAPTGFGVELLNE